MLNNSCFASQRGETGNSDTGRGIGKPMKKSFEERLQEISGPAELKAAKGLLKNDNQLAMLFTLANLFRVDQMIRQWERSQ